MARVLLVKDGKDGYPRGSKDKPLAELSGQLRAFDCRLVGFSRPNFGRTPSLYYTHVVVEVTDCDQTNDKFDRPGFYVVEGLGPYQADFLFG